MNQIQSEQSTLASSRHSFLSYVAHIYFKSSRIFITEQGQLASLHCQNRLKLNKKKTKKKHLFTICHSCNFYHFFINFQVLFRNTMNTAKILFKNQAYKSMLSKLTPLFLGGKMQRECTARRREGRMKRNPRMTHTQKTASTRIMHQS